MKIKCACCGREIESPHYLDGKSYGYNCYRKVLAVKYMQWEDEKNKEYSAKCFSAMEVFKGKKSNGFHDSIVNQWNDCKKLTAKQLQCITNDFTLTESIQYWSIWFNLTYDDMTKISIASWIENEIGKNHSWINYIKNDEVNNILLQSRNYKRYGFHYMKDIEDNIITIESNKYLEDNMKDEYIEVLKVINIM